MSRNPILDYPTPTLHGVIADGGPGADVARAELRRRHGETVDQVAAPTLPRVRAASKAPSKRKGTK